MRVLAIVHERDAGPGVFAEAARGRGDQLDTWFIAEGGPPPGDPLRYDAVLSLGGAMHADQDEAHPWLARETALLAGLLAGGTPVLGVCLGAQLLARAAGAPVGPASRPEVGWYEIEVDEQARGDPLLGPLAPRFDALEWHSYQFALPPSAVALARSAMCLQAYRIGGSAWGIQFHAEVTLGDFERWLDEERSPEEAAALGLSPEPLRARTRASIAGWNELGRRMCRQFLAVADPRASRAS